MIAVLIYICVFSIRLVMSLNSIDVINPSSNHISFFVLFHSNYTQL